MKFVHKPNRNDQQLQRTHHFDWYVSPALNWEDPNDDSHNHSMQAMDGSPGQAWIETPVSGTEKQILINALKSMLSDAQGRGLLVLAAAGSGKTVLTYMCEHVLSDKNLRQQIFGDAMPRLILRWAKSYWPNVKTYGNQPELLDLIEHDKSFQEFCERQAHGSVGSTSARKLAEYALDNGRVAIIIDAWDELEADQKKLFRQIHNEVIAKNVLLVVSSRDYAVNEEAQSFFKQDDFRRLRIQPFGRGLQDEFMKLAQKDFVVDWRTRCLVGHGEDWDKQLGIPLVLRQLAIMINQANSAKKQLPKFVSLSDLFVQTSNWMIEREFGEKDEEIEKRRLVGGDILEPADCRDILERALGAIALELSVETIWKEVKASVSQIRKLLAGAKKRFVASCRAVPGFEWDIDACWNWAKKQMSKFEINNGSLQADINTKILSFTTRHVQEMRCARYLTHYCTERDLEDALEHNGDESWRDIWKGVIKMPVGQCDVDGYQRAIKILFTRPPVDLKLRRQIHRRPTELMWIADEWIKAQSTLPGSALKGFDESLREYLGEQFLACFQDEITRATALSLIDINNYVLLADPANPSEVEDAVEKAIITQGGSFKIGQFKRDPSKNPEMIDESLEAGPIRMTKFGISKLSVSNMQFRLFDDNYAGKSDEYVKRFGDDQQPSVSVSWFDSFWYATFVEYGRRVVFVDNRLVGRTEAIRDWRVCMPEEDQFEYAYRAGSDGRFFSAFDGAGELIEVDEFTLGEYAHFLRDFKTIATTQVGSKKANGFGLCVAGNHWKWMQEWYVEGSSRLLRGGSWGNEAADCEAAYRYGSPPTNRWHSYGLVLALSPLESPLAVSGRAKLAGGGT